MILEICVDNLRSAVAAIAGGADRLEVCGPLSLGGTTPSAGLIQQCAARMATMVMIRPHSGSFRYDRDDSLTMRDDIRFAKQFGAQGVVFGALTADRRIDVATCQRMIDEARPMSVTFHRAFDVVDEPLGAMDQLVELGFDRLLTSGLARTAIEGTGLIRQLNDRAGDAITIMAGSGIDADNVNQIIETTGVTEIHASASVAGDSPGYPIDFGELPRITRESRVNALRVALDSVGGR